MMDEKEMQKKYLEYQYIGERVKQLQSQVETIESQLQDIVSTLQSLNEFEKIEGEREILVPINNGIFAKAVMKKQDSLLVNVGSSVVVDKSVDDTREIIDKQKKELESVRLKAIATLKKYAERAEQIEQELSSLME